MISLFERQMLILLSITLLTSCYSDPANLSKYAMNDTRYTKAICFYKMDYKKWDSNYEDYLLADSAYTDWFLKDGERVNISEKMFKEVFLEHPKMQNCLLVSVLENRYILLERDSFVFFYFEMFDGRLPDADALSFPDFVEDDFSALEKEEYKKFDQFVSSARQKKIQVIGRMDKRYCWFNYEGTLERMRQNEKESEEMLRRAGFEVN